MTSKYGTPMTSFSNYIKSDLSYSGPRMAPAAVVTSDAVEHVQKYWNLPEAKVGDYVLMLPNGGGRLMSPEKFKRTYVPAHTIAK